MLSVMREYLAECHRQHINPYSGFINHLSTGEINADIDDASPASIRVFALALCRVGLSSGVRQKRGGGRHQLASSSTGARPENGGQYPLKRHDVLTLPDRTEEKSDGSGVPSDESQLISICLRCGQSGRGATTSPLGPATGCHARSKAPGILAPPHRRVLKELVEGVRHAVEGSQSSLVQFELSGFPLHEMPEGTDRLVRAVALCRRLRILRLNNSPILLQQFERLTTVPHALPHVQEVALAGAGLTDAFRRGLQSLVCLGREGGSIAAWQRSLRGAATKHYTGAATGLQKLDLSDNALGDASLRALGGILRHDGSLRTLDMSRNAVTAKGLQMFLECGVLEHSALLAVDLSRNPCTASFAEGAPLILPGGLRNTFQCLQYGLGQLVLVRQSPQDTPAARAERRCPQPLRLASPELHFLPSDSAARPNPSERTATPSMASAPEASSPQSAPPATTLPSAAPAVPWSAPTAAVPTSPPILNAPYVYMMPVPVIPYSMVHADPAGHWPFYPPTAAGTTVPLPPNFAAAATSPHLPKAASPSLANPSLDVLDHVMPGEGLETATRRNPSLSCISLPLEVVDEHEGDPPRVECDTVVHEEPHPKSASTATDAGGRDRTDIVALVAPATTTTEAAVEGPTYEQTFLKLVGRLTATLEHQEMELTERLDRQHQQYTAVVESFRKDMVFRLNKLAEGQKEAAVAGKEREERRDLEAEERRRDPPDELIMDQLTRLIEDGMHRIHMQMRDDGGEKADGSAVAATTSTASRWSGVGKSGIQTEKGAKKIDFLKETSARLQEMGW